MSEGETTSNDDAPFLISLTLYPRGAPEVTIQERLLGMSPAILIEPKYLPDLDGVRFEVHAWDMDAREDLAELLAAIAETLRDGETT